MNLPTVKMLTRPVCPVPPFGRRSCTIDVPNLRAPVCRFGGVAAPLVLLKKWIPDMFGAKGPRLGRPVRCWPAGRPQSPRRSDQSHSGAFVRPRQRLAHPYTETTLTAARHG